MGEQERFAISYSVLVIGYGNTLRQDDGFGWWVAERLQQEATEGMQVIACHQLTPELAEPLSRCRIALFVDAREGEPAGQLEWETVSAVPSGNASFTHSAGPADLCLLAQTLYGSAPAQAYLLTVRSTHFELGKELSPEVEKAIEVALKRIGAFCAEGAAMLTAPQRNKEEEMTP